MKKIALFSAVLFFASVFCFGIDPAEGFWLSLDDKTGKATGGWEIYVLEGKLYGRVLSLADQPQGAVASRCRESYRGFPIAGKVNEMPVVGTPWIFGLTMEKPGVWSGGHIIDAGKGHMYKCKIIFRPMDGKKYKTDVLEMRGEIGLGIGRSMYWPRCSLEEASGLR